VVDVWPKSSFGSPQELFANGEQIGDQRLIAMNSIAVVRAPADQCRDVSGLRSGDGHLPLHLRLHVVGHAIPVRSPHPFRDVLGLQQQSRPALDEHLCRHP
jgi:hypothetical protein